MKSFDLKPKREVAKDIMNEVQTVIQYTDSRQRRPKLGRRKTLVKNEIRNPDGAKALGKNEIPILN